MTAWTKEPPKEPGWYWVRRTLYAGTVVSAEVMRLDTRFGRARVRSAQSGSRWTTEETTVREWLWWPIPIQTTQETT